MSLQVTPSDQLRISTVSRFQWYVRPILPEFQETAGGSDPSSAQRAVDLPTEVKQ